jgi:hypothetical protein
MVSLEGIVYLHSVQLSRFPILHVVDYEVEYAFDYLNWEVFGRIYAPGGVLFPQ